MKAKSIATNTASRFLADSLSLVFGMINGIITARWLGPDGKGVLASLTLLGGIFSQFSCLGLQEASIIMIGRKRSTTQEALSASMAAMLLSTGMSMLGFTLVCALEFRSNWSEVTPAILATCFGLGVFSFSNLLCGILNSRELIVFNSLVYAAGSALTALGTWLLVVLFSWSLIGAALSPVLAALVGLAALGIQVRILGLSLRPRWNTAYVLAALRCGLGIQVSYLLVAMSARIDLVLVYSLASRSAAGLYSVALTVSMISGMVPLALSIATFPRLAGLDSPEASALISKTCRLSVLATSACGMLMVLFVPIVIPLLFGSAYTAACLPTTILIGGGVPWSCMWLLARGAAARGQPWTLLCSFGASLIVMLLLDLLLIPVAGMVGAALAATLASLAGLATCVLLLMYYDEISIRISDLLPGVEDLREMTALARRLFCQSELNAES